MTYPSVYREYSDPSSISNLSAFMVDTPPVDPQVSTSAQQPFTLPPLISPSSLVPSSSSLDPVLEVPEISPTDTIIGPSSSSLVRASSKEFLSSPAKKRCGRPHSSMPLS
ncbi:hypothetical protein HMI55_005032 [Coelomomyces lativittatus]|nr:hypothetical protein HMI56_005715 [Coelomomyces lativittatus]KAJ1498255.1 hypothetical protein HMI55_005032 [Coelomomyces lativittatus]